MNLLLWDSVCNKSYLKTHFKFLAAEALLLGFQHYIVMLGTTVLIASTLVPQMGGSHVSVTVLWILRLMKRFCYFGMSIYWFCCYILLQRDKARVIQTLLFMSGVNTLLQTWFGSRLPTVMGASFAFFLPVMSIINDYTERDFSSEREVCLLQTACDFNFWWCIYLKLGVARI